MSASGLTVVRLADIPWEDRINVDNWPSKAGMYHDEFFSYRLSRLSR
jgi:hypothetical protein